MSDTILTINDLYIIYKMDSSTVHAVNGVSLSLKRSKTLGIVGETGAGKTTMALSILRLLPERTGRCPKGSIVFQGQNIGALGEEEMRKIRGDKIAMIFQDPMTSLNPVLTVGEQIYEAIELHSEKKSKGEINTRVDEVLRMVGIEPRRKREYPHQFSGGMKQRVVIAMALSCEPDLLIADEPTTALDVTIQAQVLLMMRDLKNRLGTSMIMITHDLGIIAQTCDDVAVMYAGEIIEFGTLEDIFTGRQHHPYTEGLMGSLPSLTVDTSRLKPIPGLMPDPTILSPGCSFYPRCPYRMSHCNERKPNQFIDGTHRILCNLFESKEV